MKVRVENHREHDIILHTPKAAVTIPAAKQDPEDRNRTVPGVEEVEDSHLSEARKHPVVQTYFREGWLKAKTEGKQKE